MATEIGDSDRARARRELGMGAVISLYQAAQLLPLPDEEAVELLRREGVVLRVRGREIVVWADVVEALRRVGQAPPDQAQARAATVPRGGRLQRGRL